MSSMTSIAGSIASAAIEKDTVMLANAAKTERVAAQAVIGLLEASVEDQKSRNLLAFTPSVDKSA